MLPQHRVLLTKCYHPIYDKQAIKDHIQQEQFNMMRTILFLLLLCLPCSFHACLALDVLNAGHNITGTTRFLVSNGSQAFVLGFFFPPKSTKSYLGIWYNEMRYPAQRKVVVWVANRDNPVVASNGTFQIAKDGNLVVTNTSGGIHWSSELKGSSSGNRTVKLMDSGNLVLLQDDENGTSYMWQSFQHPTDTFLPGMKMDTSMELTSWRGDSDPGSGNFAFKMLQTGNSRYVILNAQHQLYWESKELDSDVLSPQTLEYFTNSSNNSLRKQVGKPSNNSSKEINYSDTTARSWESWYDTNRDTRIVMNSTGEIIFLKWEEENHEWMMLWKQPSDKCNIYNSCGNFSSCNVNDWMNCKCLPGFSPMSVENNQLYQGGSGFNRCVRKSVPYNNNDKDLVFLNLTMIRVGNPDKNIPAETEEECQSLCLNMSHPRCQAYKYNSSSSYSDYARGPITCGIWTRDLTTLRVVEDGASDLSILVESSDIAPTARSCKPCGIYTIPYPLSTGASCGDPMYNTFNCNYSTGQVSFRMPRGDLYRVTWIDESSRKFYIQTSDSLHCYPFPNLPQIFETGSAFNVTNFCFRDYDIEISWVPPPEPPCFEPADCNKWPNSTCSETREGKRRCLCNSNYKWNASILTCTPEEKSRNRPLLILTVALTGIVFLVCTMIFAYVWRNKIAPKIDNQNTETQESLYDSERHVKGLIGLGGLEEKGSEGIEVPFYTFGSILEATDNFSDSNILGRGGYGPVYKGRFSGGQDIAVKRLSSVSNQGLEEFKNEVVLIAKLQHRNLVRLRGYCIKGDEKILLYEYMANKSLDSFVFDRTRTLLLDWQMRFDIILGIARGLLYLHQDSILRVIHRDLKTSNILLNEEMIPKISDFGLAKIFGGKETEANTNRIVGTYGYMAPEYALDGFVSIKSDVFSFGVVLLEILSGKRNTGFYQSKQTTSLLGYAWGLWTENRLLDLMDSSLRGACNEDQFIKCALIGLLCVQDEPGDRPTMSNVVTMLDSEIATIPTPTQPTFYARGRIPSTSASSSSSKPETTLHFDTSYQQGR